MINNANLHKAKAEKNNEFYTQYTDIEKELAFYKEEFAGKTVYCNCDDYRRSNFVKYFRYNFNYLGLKKLIASNYDIGEGAFLFSYDGTVEANRKLNGNGDFRSEECIEFLKEADVVVTNPPFSLFREYVKQLMDYGKKFIIIGNQNAITYKEIFPYIKNNELWLGVSMNGANRWFYAPDTYEFWDNAAGAKVENGKKMLFVNGVVWFTNINNPKRNTPIDLIKRYSNEYPHYENYDAIDCGKVAEIPMDYDGIMGVPISFLHKYCPTQFEIIGIGTGDSAKELGVTKNYRGRTDIYYVKDWKNVCPFSRLLIRKRTA